jgi:MinD superfamily P-loop ATPase
MTRLNFTNLLQFFKVDDLMIIHKFIDNKVEYTIDKVNQHHEVWILFSIEFNQVVTEISSVSKWLNDEVRNK